MSKLNVVKLLVIILVFIKATYASGCFSSEEESKVHPSSASILQPPNNSLDLESSIATIPTANTQSFPIDIDQEDTLSAWKDKIDEKFNKSIPWFMRSVRNHDLFGVIAATTTSFVPKFFGGISAIYLANIMLETTAIEKGNIPKTFFQNTTLEDFIASGLIIDFSHMSPLNNNNETKYITYPYEHNGPSNLSKETAKWGLGLGGIYSIISSIIDLTMAGYECGIIIRSDRDFKSMVIKAIELRGDRKIDSPDRFLDFAVGEYFDMYQKRGFFNKKRFISLLNNYKE